MSRRPRPQPYPLPLALAASEARRAQREHRRLVGRCPRAAWGAALLGLLLGGACAKDPPAPPADSVDAGPDCVRGTRNCACIGGTRCSTGLVCLAGRCSLNLDEEETEPGPRPRPRPPTFDPDPGTDAGNDATPDSDASTPVDAAAPDASAGAS